MLKQIAGLLFVAAVLGGCSSLGTTQERPAERPPEQPATVRQIIANSTDTLFDASANAKNPAIGELRRFNSAVGSESGGCLRALVTDRSGKNRSTATYVLFIARNRIADRRKALPADGCDRDIYQPL